MGNSESSSEFPPFDDEGNSRRSNRYQTKKTATEGEEAASSSTGTALKVGAVVAGTALLALGALSLASSSRSDDTGGRSVTQMEKLEPEGFGSSSDGDIGGHISGDGYQIPRKPYAGHLRYSDQHAVSRMFKIMSYNVWFREDVEVLERMEAIGQLIQQHSPDIIFFQEVTPNIYKIFQNSNFWRIYRCSVPPEKANRRSYFCMLLSKLPIKQFICKPFENSEMGRELCVAEIDVGENKKLVAATSHLESPTPPEMNSAERVGQANEALRLLNPSPNDVFGGDMNWEEISDGPFPLLSGWYDAWSVLSPGENGWTYDTKSNGMLRGFRPLWKRLDRFVYKLRDFRAVSVDMIGMEAIPGITWYNKRKELPVLPSDHYGLLLTICPT